MERHNAFMEQAIALAMHGVSTNQGGPFGAIIADDTTVIARGWNQVTGSNDPTAHGEIVAIRQACQVLGRFQLQGYTLYTSCEPCPMCLAACYWARLDAVWFACSRQEAKAAGFDDDFIYDQLALPTALRTLPVRHLPLTSGNLPFRTWQAKQDRIPY